MDANALKDLEYRAEFERQQFELYEARRLACETQASAVIAAALAVAALVLADYARKGHPRFVFLLAALLGILATLAFALIARFVSWNTPHLLGGRDFLGETTRPSKRVKSTLDAARDFSGENPRELRVLTWEHWRARACSAHELSLLKDQRLRSSLWGFSLPFLYLAVRLVS